MRRLLCAVTVLVLSAGFCAGAVLLDLGHPQMSEMDDYFIAHGQEETGANNIVTAVVFDYRGFDTLGEATVLFTAVLAVGLVFRKTGEGEEYEYE
ncbi:MAG: hydrogen gas-evolving membrane-bound hydrogenase subunit E [Methanoculleaceae archaeon]